MTSRENVVIFYLFETELTRINLKVASVLPSSLLFSVHGRLKHGKEGIPDISMKEIDLKTYPKRNQYTWFSTFSDPTYGFDVDMDVDALVHFSKQHKQSFFILFLYAVLNGINHVDEMRMREVKGHVYQYDVIHPTFTVMTDAGVYQNAGCPMEADFPAFAKKVRAILDSVKSLPPNGNLDRFPICLQPDVVFATCLPTLNFSGMRHPTPAGNHDNLSIPRICWGQYHLEGDKKYHVMLNITVSHTLVDGFPLAKAFQNIQGFVTDPEKTYR
jgi:chloramphenicol O-acetyltransferase type A